MGARQHTIIKDLHPTGGCVLEIGSERGDESTPFLHEYARTNGLNFYTVDFDERVCENVKEYKNVYCMTGERFMTEVFPSLKEKICFAYLDNFDWIWEGGDEFQYIIDQKKDYKDRGAIMNNTNSQKAHFDQAIEIDKYLIPNGYILFDDTWKDGEKYNGKGGSAVSYLLDHGYVVVDGLTDVIATLLRKQ